MPRDVAKGSRNGTATKRMEIVSMNVPGKRNIRTIYSRTWASVKADYISICFRQPMV